MNICKSLAAGPSPMPSSLGWVYWMAHWPEGLAFWRLGASFPSIAFSRDLQLPSREAQQPRKAMHGTGWVGAVWSCPHLCLRLLLGWPLAVGGKGGGWEEGDGQLWQEGGGLG